MNKRFAANDSTNPTLLYPGLANRKKLQPMYDEIADKIRTVDNNALIFREEVVWEVVVESRENTDLNTVLVEGSIVTKRF